ALAPERDGASRGLLPVPSRRAVACLRLHDVCEVRGVAELQPHVARLVPQVLEHDVLVRAFGDEPISAHRYRDLVVAVLARLADDTRGEVVDPAARQRLELRVVEPKVPAREMPHVLVEEALVLTSLEVTVRVRIPEGSAVEDDQVVVSHAARLSPSCRALNELLQ